MNRSIPKELKLNGKWVVRDGKVPYNPLTLKKARANDVGSFADYDMAYEVFNNNSQFDGIGLGLFDNLYAIDIDHCIVDGMAKDYAVYIVEAFSSYTEISPSGAGLHIIGYISGFPFDKEKYYINNQKQHIEVYISGVTAKYITITGNRFNDYELSICEHDTMLKFLEHYMKKDVMNMPFSNPITSKSEGDYLSLGLAKDSKLKRFYDGERVLTDKSESENDLSFMSKLMYWCNNDSGKAVSAFLNSPYTAKKDEYHKQKIQRNDYMQGLVKSAVQNSTILSDTTKNKLAENDDCVLISATQLHQNEYPQLKYLVDGLVPEGTTILAAAPKSGKSWFVLDLGLKVAANGLFLGRETTQSAVLYLALEDSERRLKERMEKILKRDDVPEKMFFLTDIPNIDNGFMDKLEKLLTNHPDIKLVIVDTFQKIRGKATSKEQIYQYDYREMGLLKKFADRRGISLLFVHHTRKMKDKDDPNNMISGSNGISGAVDTILVMTKENRSESETQLHISGRDVNQATLLISFDQDNFEWKCEGDFEAIIAAREQEQFDSDPTVKAIKHLLNNSGNGEWCGFARDIFNIGKELGLVLDSPQKVGYAIKGYEKVFAKYSIEYICIDRGANNSKKHHFKYHKTT